MFDTQLETFIKVAEAKSFNKASELLFVTPPAVIKQINLLEGQLDVKLFNRTHRGLTLTPAGESFYKDAVYMTGYLRDAVERARSASGEQVIRIGVSAMTPVQPVMEMWPEVKRAMPGVHIMVVPFENTPENAREILQYLGERIDVVAGIFDEQMLDVRQCAGTELMRLPFQLAVSMNHPLAQKKKLTMADLSGEKILLMKRGWSHYVDALRDDLRMNYKDIKIEDFDFYDVNVFNRCENNEGLLLAVEPWKYVHPLLRIIPVEWDYSIPYGILHSSQPSPLIKKFIQAVTEIVKTDKKQ
jgi:DNA-binding transcriptional LysR family regulator